LQANWRRRGRTWPLGLGQRHSIGLDFFLVGLGRAEVLPGQYRALCHWVLPSSQESFVVELDARATGIGAVLMQQDRLVAFLSKALGPAH
jgi:hypothetical protein